MSQGLADLHTRASTSADGRAVITRRVHAPADVVWAVLADGWLYANWVVGASRIRDVEPDWPRPGSRLHHSFGVWPALIDDHTQVLTADPGRTLVLKARGWPAGEARVRIQVTANGPDSSTIIITEDAIAGPGRLLPRPAWTPGSRVGGDRSTGRPWQRRRGTPTASSAESGSRSPGSRDSRPS